MEEQMSTPKSYKVESFKIAITFISTIVIAATGIFINHQYNKKQLKLLEQQSKDQLKLTSIKEIAKLVPKLGSENKNERKFAAIALGLYGHNSVPALKELLEDKNNDIQLASLNSLLMIANEDEGEDIISYLKEKYDKEYTLLPGINRSILVELARRNDKWALNKAINILDDKNSELVWQRDAASALRYFDDKKAIECLLRNYNDILHDIQNYEQIENKNIENLRYNVVILGRIIQAFRYNDLLDDYLKEKDLKRTDIIVKYVCQDNIPLRQETTWVLKVIWNIDLNTLLANIISDGNRSEEIKKIAKNVINCAK